MLNNKSVFILKKNIYSLCVLILFAGLNACTNVTNASEEAKKSVAATTYQLEPFILNLPDNGSPKFLKISMVLVLANAALVETAKKKQAPIKDAIISIVTSKSPGDLLSQEGKVLLKDELIMRINQILKEGSVKNIYFTELIMQ
jgi:flagellar basal body-associated protein FliL